MANRHLARVVGPAGKCQTPNSIVRWYSRQRLDACCVAQAVCVPPRVGKPLARPRSKHAVVLHPHGLHWLPRAAGRARACAPLMSTVLTRKSDSAAANSCPVDAFRTLETGAGAPAAAAHATARSAAYNSRPVRGPAGRRGIVGPGRVQRGCPRASPAARTGAAERLGSR